MNFRKGDIFNQTTKVFTEIDGTMDNGVGVNASFIGSYNAIDSLNSPTLPSLMTHLMTLKQM